MYGISYYFNNINIYILLKYNICASRFIHRDWISACPSRFQKSAPIRTPLIWTLSQIFGLSCLDHRIVSYRGKVSKESILPERYITDTESLACLASQHVRKQQFCWPNCRHDTPPIHTGLFCRFFCSSPLGRYTTKNNTRKAGIWFPLFSLKNLIVSYRYFSAPATKLSYSAWEPTTMLS